MPHKNVLLANLRCIECMAGRDGTFLPALRQEYSNIKWQTKQRADYPTPNTAPSEANSVGLDDSDLGIDLDSTLVKKYWPTPRWVVIKHQNGSCTRRGYIASLLYTVYGLYLVLLVIPFHFSLVERRWNLWFLPVRIEWIEFNTTGAGWGLITSMVNDYRRETSTCPAKRFAAD